MSWNGRELGSGRVAQTINSKTLLGATRSTGPANRLQEIEELLHLVGNESSLRVKIEL